MVTVDKKVMVVKKLEEIDEDAETMQVGEKRFYDTHTFVLTDDGSQMLTMFLNLDQNRSFTVAKNDNIVEVRCEIR